MSDDEDVVCPGCEAEKRGEKGVPHVGDDFNVPPNKPEEKAANRFDFDKMEENLRPELKEPLELLMRDLQIIREQQKLIREDEEKEIEEEQKDWPEEKRAAWRAELQEYRDRHMAIAFGDDTEGREPIVHPDDRGDHPRRRPGRHRAVPEEDVLRGGAGAVQVAKVHVTRRRKSWIIPSGKTSCLNLKNTSSSSRRGRWSRVHDPHAL